MNGSHHVGLLLGSEDAVLSITKFLSAKDCLNLHAVSRGWHAIISTHDETLFGTHLREDFDEGDVLAYVAEKKNLSCKKLYRAFRGRWSLPKQVDPNIRQAAEHSDVENRENKILIPWAKPEEIPREHYHGAKLLIPNDDVDNVVFIALIRGAAGTSTALMDWDPGCNSNHPKKLIIDKSWCSDEGNFVFPIPSVSYIDGHDSPFALTLHAIDTKYYQVASLLDDSPLDKDGCYFEEDSKIKLYYGNDCPTLYAMPPKGSPFHLDITESDFEYFQGDGGESPPLHKVSNGGVLALHEVEGNGRLIDDDYSDEEDYEYEYDYEYKLQHPSKGMHFYFGGEGGMFFSSEHSVEWPHHVCSFLRALMKEKCHHIEPRGLLGSVVVQQPRWIQEKKILDKITSFLCFEDQVGKLRLVSRQFLDSALRQLQTKLDKSGRIGFMGEAWQEPYDGKRS